MNLKFLKDFLKYKKYQYLTFKKNNFKYDKNPSTENYINQLKKNGYVVIKNYFSIENCQKIRRIIDNFIQLSPEMTWRDKLGSDIRIHGAENISKEMRELVDEKINFTQKIGEQYTNQEIGLYMMMANRTMFKNSNLGSGQGWHKDSYCKQFKSILYLSDIDENNGPLQIIKKSNSNLFMLDLFLKLKNKFPSTRFLDDEILNTLKIKEDQIIELKYLTGTLILFDTSYIHRGKPLKENIRYALTNYFYPKEMFPSHENHFQPMLKKIIN